MMLWKIPDGITLGVRSKWHLLGHEVRSHRCIRDIEVYGRSIAAAIFHGEIVHVQIGVGGVHAGVGHCP